MFINKGTSISNSNYMRQASPAPAAAAVHCLVPVANTVACRVKVCDRLSRVRKGEEEGTEGTHLMHWADEGRQSLPPEPRPSTSEAEHAINGNVLHFPAETFRMG